MLGVDRGKRQRLSKSYLSILNPVTDGVAGTTGQAKQLEAVKIFLAGNNANDYDVYYNAHVSNKGWMGWSKDGEVAGTTSQSLPIEAIRIIVVSKDYQKI